MAGLSVSVQVVGECQLTVNKLAAFLSVKMFNECVISHVLTAVKLRKWLSSRMWHLLPTQVRKETAAPNFRVVHATAGTKLEIYSELLLSVYENTPYSNVIPISNSSIMIITLLPVYELKQLITTCFYDYNNVFCKSSASKFEAVTGGHNSVKGNFVMCVRNEVV